MNDRHYTTHVELRYFCPHPCREPETRATRTSTTTVPRCSTPLDFWRCPLHQPHPPHRDTSPHHTPPHHHTPTPPTTTTTSYSSSTTTTTTTIITITITTTALHIHHHHHKHPSASPRLQRTSSLRHIPACDRGRPPPCVVPPDQQYQQQ